MTPGEDDLSDTSRGKQKQEPYGIETMRKIKQRASLKPMGETKAIILYNADALSIPAQNALLKLLEEPPPHTMVVLTAEKEDMLLPTILSRCHSILLPNARRGKDETQESQDYSVLLATSPSLKDRLLLAETIAKSDPISWIEGLIFSGRDRLLQAVEAGDTVQIPRLTRMLFLAQEIHTSLKTTNTNIRLSVEYLLLSV